MALKSFDEMRAIDVLPYCEHRRAKDDNGKEIMVPYLNWARCKQLLHENGAGVVYFDPVTGADGSSLIRSDVVAVDKWGAENRCYEVRVRIVIDDLVFEMQTPLLNGSLVVTDKTLNQLRVGNAQARAFVKGVAIRTGLGFDLWLKDPVEKTGMREEPEDGYSIKERLRKKANEAARRAGGARALKAATGFSDADVRTILGYADRLMDLELALDGVLHDTQHK